MKPQERDDRGLGGGCIIGVGLLLAWVAAIGLLGWWGLLLGALGAVALGFWMMAESFREVAK